MMRPDTETALADMMRAANEPISVRGGGTRGMESAGAPLTTAGLSGVTLYEPGALTLVAQAGTPVAEIEEALAAENQRLAFEPMDHRALLGTDGTPTIGGVIAGNVSGPRRVQAGAARDFALGVRFIDGSGAVVKNGGRVMKNVTGYDLVKLLCGSWGTLGVLTEVSLKVLPMPQTQATLSLAATDPAAAIALMSDALGSPFDVSGAAWDGARVLLRLEGFEDSVTYRSGALAARLLSDHDMIDANASADLWRDVRDVRAFADLDAVWKVSIKPSDAPAYLAALDSGVPYRRQMDWAGGLIWIGMTAADLGAGDAPAGGLRDAHTKLQDLCAQLGGHATLVKAPDGAAVGLPRFQPEAPGVAALSAGLRARFDPRGLLNPGLMSAAA